MTEEAVRSSEILLEAGTNELEVITFYMRWIDPETGSSRQATYGINAAKVMEMVAMPEKVTSIAESPDCVKGVFLLRGKTITLIDLCNWFEYEPDTSPEQMRQWTVVVAEINGKPFGFITHGVDKVYRVSWEDIMVPPEMLAKYQSITGICLISEQVIQMVDFENIISAIDPSMNLEKRAIDEHLTGNDGNVEKTIIIADDSRTIQRQLSNMLEKAAYKVKVFSDGQAAWDYIEELKIGSGIDATKTAIISDIEMPRMDGHHLCMKIKKDPDVKNLPVILFSSMINESLHAKGISVGADDQITKPEIGELLQRLQACFDKQQ